MRQRVPGLRTHLTLNSSLSKELPRHISEERTPLYIPKTLNKKITGAKELNPLVSFFAGKALVEEQAEES